MTIEHIFTALSIPPKAAKQLSTELSLPLHASMDEIMISHTPAIGRAVSAVRGEKYLDEATKQYPLTVIENAMRYGSLALEPFF